MTSDPVRATRIPHFRQQEILQTALRDGSVDVTELAHRFDVTTETIRRDLSDLQERQLVRRVHGGAVPVQRHSFEPRIEARDTLNTAEKHAIATQAVLQLPERGSIIIDSGSTGRSLAEIFPIEHHIHVITNSLITGVTLAQRGVQQLTVLGGSVTSNTFAMVDASVVESIRRLRVDVLFISCDGLSLERGLTTPYREESLVKRAMIEAARWVVVIVDATKFGNDQTFGFADFDDIDVLITDTRATDDDIQRIESAGVEVQRAG